MFTDKPDKVGAFPDLGWWLQDRERWQLLAFDGHWDDAGLVNDLASKDRRDVLEALICVPGQADADFARFLLAQETLWHGHAWGFSHSIEIAALLVAEHRAVKDVWLLWQAITRSFDTWLGLPHGLLYAPGKDTVLAYLENCKHPQRSALLDHIPEIAQTTDENITQLLTNRRRHYQQADI